MPSGAGFDFDVAKYVFTVAYEHAAPATYHSKQ